MKDFNLFFSNLNEPYCHVFANCERVWEPLKVLGSLLEKLIIQKAQNGPYISSLKGVRTSLELSSCKLSSKGIYVEDWVNLSTSVYLKELNIFIGKGTQLEPSAIIIGPAMIGDNCDIRQGAYIRGNALI